MLQISVADPVEVKIRAGITLRTTARPSTSAAANSLSRTRTLSTVTLKGRSTLRGEASLPLSDQAALILLFATGRHWKSHLE